MNKVAKSIYYVLLTVGVAVSMFPLVWIFVFAFLPEDAVKKYPPKLIPDSLYIENFKYVFERTNIVTGMANSFIVVVGAVILVLALGSIGAYGIAKSSEKVRTAAYIILLVTQMVPAVTNMIPIYSIMSVTGLLDTRFGLSLVYAAQQLPLSMLIMIGFFKQAVVEVEESAMIDGCNWWGVFARISLPMCKPGLVSAIIFTFALSWNEFMMAMLLTSSPGVKTFQVTLYDLLQTESQYRVRYNVLTAAALLGLLPILIVYGFFQKGFTEGLTAGSIK